MLEACLAALCALLAAWYVQDLRAALRAPALSPSPGAPSNGPLVSVVVPARDEAARIGGCLAGLAAQTYRRFEAIVVDDGSRDGTAAVARGFAEGLPALRVVAGVPPPSGWAGKPWACWQGAGLAQGELLLFLDADVLPRPGLLAALAARMADGGPDVLTLVPLIELRSAAELLVLPAFMNLVAVIYPLEKVNDPRSPLAFAIGQCLMLRRAAYEELGGHWAVRGSVLEDVELARRAKAGGLRLEAAVAPDLIAVRMYAGWRELAEGLGKNAVAGLRSGGRRAAWAGVRQGLMAALPLDMLAAGLWLSLAAPGSATGRWLALAGGLLLAFGACCWGLAVQRRHRASAAWGALLPLGTALYFWLAARALLRLRGGQGVMWKGRVFPQ
ncbi:MAG TPA: glycosyltransferase family A protein [Roseiflexaceae bacterium]|nr:glycosyltransferase family A protein [Roseiflexaceae bacterium]